MTIEMAKRKGVEQMIQTNKTIHRNSELGKAAHRLLEAAHDYWEVYQRECGPGAVVWLETTNGHFVLFTRGEYKRVFLQTVPNILDKPVLFDPFVESPDKEADDE